MVHYHPIYEPTCHLVFTSLKHPQKENFPCRSKNISLALTDVSYIYSSQITESDVERVIGFMNQQGEESLLVRAV